MNRPRFNVHDTVKVTFKGVEYEGKILGVRGSLLDDTIKYRVHISHFPTILVLSQEEVESQNP
jgi:hypothetical protein